MTMMQSRFDTVAVRQLELSGGTRLGGGGASQKKSAAALVAAGQNPMRVVVRNISFAAECYLAFDANALQTNEPGGGTYKLPAGAVDTIMLAPEQRLYAISLSDGCKVCLAISEALPVDAKP